MVPAGVGAEQLTIQHMGKPGQRMPVTGVACGKGPDNAVSGKAGLDVLIVSNVLVVIVVYETVSVDRPERREGCQAQKNTYRQVPARAERLVLCAGRFAHISILSPNTPR